MPLTSCTMMKRRRNNEYQENPQAMGIRIATRADIPELQIIRSSVTENVLTSIITEEMIIEVMEDIGGFGFMSLKDRRWGFQPPTREYPTSGRSSSYRPGRNEASANSCCMRQLNGSGLKAQRPFSLRPTRTHELKNSIGDKGGSSVESNPMARSEMN